MTIYEFDKKFYDSPEALVEDNPGIQPHSDDKALAICEYIRETTENNIGGMCMVERKVQPWTFNPEWLDGDDDDDANEEVPYIIRLPVMTEVVTIYKRKVHTILG